MLSGPLRLFVMPSAAVRGRWLAALVAAAASAGCGEGARTASDGDGDGHASAASAADASVQRALRTPRAARMLRRCPLTHPNESVPPGEGRKPGGDATGYLGNGRLWTVLPPRGVLVAGPGDVQRDGSIARKFPWWRGVRGDLRITGRRLDAGDAALRARIPSGYGPTGFQSSAIVFPSEGCWRVTGSAGSARLSFVTLVVKAPPQ